MNEKGHKMTSVARAQSGLEEQLLTFYRGVSIEDQEYLLNLAQRMYVRTHQAPSPANPFNSFSAVVEQSQEPATRPRKMIR